MICAEQQVKYGKNNSNILDIIIKYLKMLLLNNVLIKNKGGKMQEMQLESLKSI